MLAVLRLGLGDLQHHREAIVLLRLGDVGRLAVEREVVALDLEAVRRGGLRRDRRTRHRDHRLQRRVAGVGDLHRLRRMSPWPVVAEHRGLDRRAVDVERDRVGLLRHRPRRQQQPRVLLRRGVGGEPPRRLDAFDRAGQRRARRVAFARERDQRCGIAQRRAVVGAAEHQHRLRLQVLQRRRVDLLGAAAVADQRERCGELRLGDRRRDRVQLGVGEITEVADRGDAVLRQHIELVSQLAAAVLVRLIGIGDAVAQPVDGLAERDVGHGKILLASPGQEVGDVGIEPAVIAARPPQTERTVRALPRQQAIDRILDALVDVVVEREVALPPRGR